MMFTSVKQYASCYKMRVGLSIDRPPLKHSLVDLIEFPILHNPVTGPAAEVDIVPIRSVIVGRVQQLDPAGLKSPFRIEQKYGLLLGDRLAAVVHRPALWPDLIGYDGLRAPDAPPTPGVLIERIGG